MLKSLLAAAAVAVLLAIAVPGGRATAMPLAAPAQLSVATTDAGLVQQAAYHCRYRHCGWRRHYWGWPLPADFVRPWIRLFFGPWPRPYWRWHHRHWRHHR
jgi:hypothetical protein